MDEYLRNSEDSAQRSPYLLDIGKAIVGLAEILQDIRERRCPSNDDGGDDGNCIESQFRRKSRPEIRDFDVYEALRMQPRLHSVRYAVAMKTRHNLVEVALYSIEVSASRAFPEKAMAGMPALCLRDLVENCESCVNFHDGKRIITKGKNYKREKSMMHDVTR